MRERDEFVVFLGFCNRRGTCTGFRTRAEQRRISSGISEPTLRFRGLPRFCAPLEVQAQADDAPDKPRRDHGKDELRERFQSRNPQTVTTFYNRSGCPLCGGLALCGVLVPEVELGLAAGAESGAFAVAGVVPEQELLGGGVVAAGVEIGQQG